MGLWESPTAPLRPIAAIPPHPALLQARRHNPRLPLKSPRKITLIIEPQLRRHAGDALPALEELRRRLDFQLQQILMNTHSRILILRKVTASGAEDTEDTAPVSARDSISCCRKVASIWE